MPTGKTNDEKIAALKDAVRDVMCSPAPFRLPPKGEAIEAHGQLI